MAESPILVVLAAGMGSRYGGIKQIEAVGPHKESLIDYSIYNSLKAGFKKIVMIIRKEIQEDVKNFFKDKIPAYIPIEWVFQELDNIPSEFSVPPNRKKPWGTGHALLMCKDVLHAPFAVINGDDYYAYEAMQNIASFLNTVDITKPHYALVGYELLRTLSPHGSVSRGICQVDEQNNLQSLQEHKKILIDTKSNQIISMPDDEHTPPIILQGNEATSMNLFGFTPHFLSQLEVGFQEFLKKEGSEEKSEFFIPAFLGELLTKQEAFTKVIPTQAEWFGITYQEDKASVQAHINLLIEKKIYSSPLWT